MPTCIATLKNGIPCVAPSRAGFQTCGWHKNVGMAVPVVLCVHVGDRGRVCSRHAAGGDTLCVQHRREREYERNAGELEDRIHAWMWGDNPPRSVREIEDVVDQVLHDDLIDDYDHMVVMDWVETEWVFFQRARPTPTVAARSDLHALALDAQNVHTSVVNRQTSDALSVLLETAVPSRPCTLAAVKHAWEHRPGRSRVVRDMDQWYSTSECRSAGDWLYRRAMDGLWVRIQSSPHKNDLIERLWEECSDAVGMCCEGHLSRIANVLVGFDMSVRADVPVGDILQQKIAAIAAMDVSVEDKVGRAWAVFDELDIPMDKRIEWVDAF
jgi:hypothetical protein